jgi:hypothetical protein
MFPGVRVNISKGGLSTSFGIPGATVNVGRRGIRGTVGIPGTGLSYSANLTPSVNLPASGSQGHAFWTPPSRNIPHSPSIQLLDPAMQSISSASVEWLTSPSLSSFKQMVIDARAQRHAIDVDLKETRTELKKREREQKLKGGILKPMFKSRIVKLAELIPDLRKHIGELNAWYQVTHIEVSFDTSQAASSAFSSLIRAFDRCRACSIIWDVTAERASNRVRERTTASRVVDRRPVRFDYDDSDLIRFSGRALRMVNANGDDILIYPGMLLVPRVDGQFALLDLREVVITTGPVTFIEEEKVPPDSRIVGHTWAKANKDGSPDRRFANNYQIPICEYGLIRLSSNSGLNEEFQFSNAQAAHEFGLAFAAYASALASTSN